MSNVWDGMIAQYHTLLHVARSMNEQMSGTRVSAVFSQEKRQLVLTFESDSSLTPDRERLSALLVSCEPSNNFLYLKESFARSKKNSVDLLKGAVGTTVVRVAISPTDREIMVALTEGGTIAIRMFGPKANVVLTDASHHVVEAFLRHRQDRLHSESNGLRAQPELPTRSLDARDIAGMGNVPLVAAVRKAFPQFGALLARESVHRSSLSNHDSAANLSENEAHRLLRAGQALVDELLASPAPRIYYRESTPVAFSLISLKHLDGVDERKFESIHDAIQTYVGSTHKSRLFTRRREDVLSRLHTLTGRHERTVQHIERDREKFEEPESWELKGKLLTAHLHAVRRGTKLVRLEDNISGSGEAISVQLDPNQSPAQNADTLFQKAKKARKALAELDARSKAAREELDVLSKLASAVNSVSSEDELEEIFSERREVFRKIGLVSGGSRIAPKTERPPFRIFTVKGGFQVWAGKSGENNDLLTTRHTKQNDLWFHARGVGGSHVVLKTGTGKGEPSKEAIAQAAAIAAHYSKMRKAHVVPVTMCLGKYVRKSKGSPPGTVTVEREKLLFVEPALPPHNRDTEEVEP